MPDINEVLQQLKSLPRLLDSHAKKIIDISPEDNFQRIRRLIDKLDKPATPLPPPRSEYYLQQWQQFKHGKIVSLDRAALKYLCWESDLLEDSDFCDYLMQNLKEANARAIKGLIRSIHLKWEKDSPDKKIVRFTARQLSSIAGKDRTISKWKSEIDMILGKSGPALFAKNVFLGSHADPKNAADQWALAEYSAYMRYAVVNAADQCMEHIGRDQINTNFVLDTLFYWNGWESNRSGFDFITKELILHNNVNAIAEELRGAVLGHKLLGDPRLPANQNKWLGVDAKAMQRFIGWLARRDIVFFFDNVLQGNDPDYKFG